MITNFDNTQPLSDFEIAVSEFICDLFSGKITGTPILKTKPVLSPKICHIITVRFKTEKPFAPQRLRACMNYIRTKEILFIGSTSKGYFYVQPTDIETMDSITQSMDERANGIIQANNGLKAIRDRAVRNMINNPQEIKEPKTGKLF